MKPKIVQVIGKKIKAKLALVYLIIALLCAGFVLLSEFLFSDFKKHREQYECSTKILLETHNLLSQFYNIQEYANRFLLQKEMQYLNIYQTEIVTFQQKLEYILQFVQHKDENINLMEVLTLLQEKKEMLKNLQKLFANKEDIDSLYKRIAAKIEKETNKEKAAIMEANSTLLADTVWRVPKNFGQRLKDAFRSQKKRGKEIATITTSVINDSNTLSSLFVTPLLDSLQEVTQLHHRQYTTKIEQIEIELYALLTADQNITKEITTLLLQLHEDMLLNVIALGEEYEKNAQKALVLGVVAGVVALLLITLFILFIFRNIREIRITHEALRLEKQKTEELMEHRHQLLLAISHDIKTPLNALLGYLELWENETLTPTQLRELNTMQYSGKYILSLLNNLLEFTRLEQKKSQIIHENIEIVPFFMEIFEMFQPLCSEKNNTLVYHINVHENPQVVIDSLKLKQVIVNLISNAVKYTTEGTINVQIEEILTPNLQLKVTISDTGKGIPQDKLTTLFEPFTRVEKNSTGIEGSGLGLFVVKGLVELLDGKIELQTEETKGTVVTFSIPCENVLESMQPVVSQHESLKIWVIEDDATQLQVIVSMLQKLGHTATTISDKTSFNAIISANGKTPNDLPHLVFTDLEMGDLNGYDVLQEIKSISDLPVICLSGISSTKKAELQQLGFDYFLEKPFTLSQLGKMLISISKRKTENPSCLFSLDTLNEMFNNDKETISALLRTFSASLPNDIQQLKEGVAEKNLLLIQQTVHRILPFCKQINAHEVVPILEKIELSKKQNHIHFDNLETDTILIVGGLKRLLGELKIQGSTFKV